MDYLPFLIALASAVLGVFGKTTHPDSHKPTRLGWAALSIAVAAAALGVWNTTSDLRERASFRSQVHMDLRRGLDILLSPYVRHYASFQKSTSPATPSIKELSSEPFVDYLRTVEVNEPSNDTTYGRSLREFEVLARSANAGSNAIRSSLTYGSTNIALPVRTSAIAVANAAFLLAQVARSETLQRLLDEHDWREGLRREQGIGTIHKLSPQFVLPPKGAKSESLVSDYRAFITAIDVMEPLLKE